MFDVKKFTSSNCVLYKHMYYNRNIKATIQQYYNTVLYGMYNVYHIIYKYVYYIISDNNYYK